MTGGQQSDLHNGPDPETYYRYLARALDFEFHHFRNMAQAGHNMAAYEAVGGDKKDLRDGLRLSKLSRDAQLSEARRQARTWGYHGVVLTIQDDTGQGSFTPELDARAPQTGYNGLPLGSEPSVKYAIIDGWNAGRGGSLALEDNPWLDVAGAEKERNGWDVGFGAGVKDRPMPRRTAVDAEDGNVVTLAKRRGRPKGSKNRPKSSGEMLAERAQALDDGGRSAVRALPPPEWVAETDKLIPGWRGDRDFTQEEPPPPAA